MHTHHFENRLQADYYGGVWNPVDGRIYLAPRNVTRAARFDPATKKWEAFGDTFAKTEFCTNDKWHLPALSSIDNCMYAVPMLGGVANRVLKIDPANGTAREVGADLRELIGEVINGNWAYFGTIEGGDGDLYGIPCNATCVLRFDPRTNEAGVFGHLENPVQGNYYGGVLGPSGRHIFAIPAMASRVLCIDTEKLTVELIGDDFGCGPADKVMQHSKWANGALGADDCIYAIPFSGNIPYILRIDPAAKTASIFGPCLYGTANGWSGNPYGWMGVTRGLDGCLYLTPHGETHILRIDVFTGTVSTLDKAFPPSLRMKLAQGVTDRDGAIWFLPLNAPCRMFRIAPGRSRTELLTTLSQSQHRALLLEGLRDYRCYGPALMVELWRESVRPGGDSALVSELLEAAATVIPAVITASFKTDDDGLTALMLLKTIVAVLPLQVDAPRTLWC